ncbi:MAG: hypothetical protein ABIQ44_07030, partial [Chloroflexia bacterium]
FQWLIPIWVITSFLGLPFIAGALSFLKRRFATRLLWLPVLFYVLCVAISLNLLPTDRWNWWLD